MIYSILPVLIVLVISAIIFFRNMIEEKNKIKKRLDELESPESKANYQIDEIESQLIKLNNKVRDIQYPYVIKTKDNNYIKFTDVGMKTVTSKSLASRVREIPALSMDDWELDEAEDVIEPQVQSSLDKLMRINGIHTSKNPWNPF